MVIIAIVGLGAGATGGIFITNSKNKVVIADMQAKMQKSEAVSQDRIRSYEIVVSQLNDELRLAKTEIELLKTPAPAAEQTPPPAAEIEPIIRTVHKLDEPLQSLKNRIIPSLHTF